MVPLSGEWNTRSRVATDLHSRPRLSYAQGTYKTGLCAVPEPWDPPELTRVPTVLVRQATFGSPGRFTQVAAAVDDRSGGAHLNCRAVPAVIHRFEKSL